MPHLCQFSFHIRSILDSAPHVEIDTIRQSFLRQQQSVDCTVDYFNHNYRTLEVFNKLEQQEKITATTNNLKFTHLDTLILFDIHMDYAEQLLCRTYLPCLNELAIRNDILLTIITQDQHQTIDNCSRVERLTNF
jgi:hypothetical protein